MAAKELFGEAREDALRLRKIWDAKRHELRLNQRIAAERLEISPPVWSSYLNQKLEINDRNCFRFAQLLACDPKDIKPSYIPPEEALRIKPETRAKHLIPLLKAPDLADLCDGSKQLDDFPAEFDSGGDVTPTCFAFEVISSASIPTVYPGELVVAERNETSKLGKVALILYQQDLLVVKNTGAYYEPPTSQQRIPRDQANELGVLKFSIGRHF